VEVLGNSWRMSVMGDRKAVLKEIPEVVRNPQNGKQFAKGKFLGKGGFARCYELMDTETRIVYAGKIVSKTLLVKKHQREKMTQEIQIHRMLSHPHVVRLDGFFEDADNVYVLLELCSRRSLMELHKRRRAVTEPEARYFTNHVVLACIYLHDKKIIHRDLKLGNLFLNDDMEVKIGDFGLATMVEFDGERKKTLCGTPNYIAPEMLGKKGHSYEVDIWAIGCILYTLLVGKPPFETLSLKETYQKIKENDYIIPSRISADARHLIERLLAADPSARPNIHEVAQFDFFTKGYLPSRLPTSCLTMAPKFQPSQLVQLERRVVDGARARNALSPRQQARQDMLAAPLRALTTVPETQAVSMKRAPEERNDPACGDVPSDCYLSELYAQISELLTKKASDRPVVQEDEAEDPAAVPVFWVSKWVDYSDKYGLGYQLCDNSVGVVFNDNTKLVLDAAGEQVQYTERDNSEQYYTISVYPKELTKKMTLLAYFRNYMNEHLQKTGANMAVREGDELARLPCLRTWFRTRSAIVLHMSNGTLQINFFQDHTKLIVCPLICAATYIDPERNFHVYRFDLIDKFGCPRDVFSRLKYARTMIERLLSQSGNTNIRPGSLSTADARIGKYNTPSHRASINSPS
uniref:Serine/threonine-protein kinase PLK n=2 Tax=Parascaris univalens TaxID=6257 RepID=A0A915B2S8_PARUN